MLIAKRAFINKRRLSGVLIIFGVILALLAIVLTINNHQVEPAPPPNALTSKAAPSSVKPAPQTVASYSVPPTNPQYITVPAIGIAKTEILRLGLTNGGAIAVPGNIYDVGWYDGSSKPGQSGAMFIYGHVSSWTAEGVFYNLKKLKPGDDVMITRGDSTTYTYQVITSKIYTYNNVDMDQVLAPINPNKPSLNLMTCTGEVIKGTSEFNERLVVFTSLVSD